MISDHLARWNNPAVPRDSACKAGSTGRGNVRVRFADFNADGRINIIDEGKGQEKELIASYHYYPFGMMMEGIFHPTMEEYTENSYRYNACPAIAFSDDGELNILATRA